MKSKIIFNELKNLNGLKSKKLSITHSSVRSTFYLSIYLSIYPKNIALKKLKRFKVEKDIYHTHVRLFDFPDLSIYPKNIALKKLKRFKVEKDIYHTHVRLFDLPDLSIYLSIYLFVCIEKKETYV